jgi:hypothetical protein
MKTCADRGVRPYKGYIAPCSRCGALVVHANVDNLPFHMHRRSEKCRKAAETYRRRSAGYFRSES